jgi:hypothetical protein
MFWESSVVNALGDINDRIRDTTNILKVRNKLTHNRIYIDLNNIMRSTRALVAYRSDIDAILDEMNYPIDDSVVISDAIATVREINIILNDPEIISEITETLVNRALLSNR